jgi:cytochrome b involved in lipid metabolism
MSSDPEIGSLDNSVHTKDTASSQDQIEKIRNDVAKLQGIERGIFKNSRKLTVEKGDSLNGSGRDSLRGSRRGSIKKPEDPDETVQNIRKEILRLQDLERGLVGGSKSSKKLRTPSSMMSLTPEQLEKHQKYTRAKKYSAIVVGVLIMAGVVAGIVSLVNFLQDNNISFTQVQGGNTPSTLGEVALHATPDDCWAALDGDVYDLTVWVDTHPGGSIYIQSICGNDGTDIFIAQHPSSFLKAYVAQYRVGPLVAATEAPQDTTLQDETEDPQEPATTDAPVSTDITLDVLALHNTTQDCWVALYGNVYDLTQWATVHPGGSQRITDLAGTDGTAVFATNHLKTTLTLAESFMLGALVA